MTDANLWGGHKVITQMMKQNKKVRYGFDFHSGLYLYEILPDGRIP